MERDDRYGRQAAWLLAIGLVAGAPLHHASAEQVIAAGSSQTQTLDCDGGEAVLRGNENQIQFTGRCRALLIEGNSNQVRAQLRGGAPVTVRGNDNAVTYRAEGGENAAVQLAGMNNNVTPEAGSAAAPALPPPVPVGDAGGRAVPGAGGDDALALREENARRTVDCAGKAILIEGNGDDYTLRGGCRSLTVRGEGLRIRAQMQPGSQITLQGNGDIVTWSLSADGPDPSTSVDGEGSRINRSSRAADRVVAPVYAAPAHIAPTYIAPAAPVPFAPAPFVPQSDVASVPTAKPPMHHTPVAPAPQATAEVAAGSVAGQANRLPPSPQGKLIVSGDHEARDMDCAGRDVRIDANFELIVLRGGCRSVTIKGDSNKVQAEIIPGAHIAVTGAVNAIAYVALGGAPGQDVVTSIVGENDHIRRIPALGAIADTSNR